MTVKIPTPITLQNQPTWNTCASTCLAMLLDVPVQEVVDEFHEDYVGHTGVTPRSYLESKGLIMKLGNPEQQFDWDSVYLVGVPSLNLLGAMHYIVMDFRFDNDWVIYDPNCKKEDKKYYTNDLQLLKEDNNSHEIGGWSIDLYWENNND